MLDQAKTFLKANTHNTHSYDEFRSIIESKRGFIRACWCGERDCEDRLKEETMATIRLILDEKVGDKDTCLICQRNAKVKVVFARAY
jgi:prolyl-tRNA synthetase